MKKLSCFIITLFIVVFSLFSQADEKFKGWKKADTEHFTFIYENSSKETVDSYALIADKAWNKIANIYSIPVEHMNIYVTDRTNTVNAFTYFSPLEIVMFTTPVSTVDFGYRADWKEMFFTHELIHAANVSFEDKSTVPQMLMGPLVNTIKFSMIPGWALEGLTTVLETELTTGGRGRSPYFELQFKGPAVENSLISYSEIGLEAEPPRGQAYVMGYLIMRSIADRFGIQALADIERNRNMFVSWEDSVKLVTGYTAEEIYRDVKIAITKRYAQERTIPEGITISPRTVNTNYFNPAVILDDGSLITLRTKSGSKAAIVKLDPSKKDGSTYVKYTNPEEDLNTLFNETVLVEGAFSDENCVTADSKGTVYASMAIEEHHKAPGTTVELPLYKWSEADGLIRITKKGSYGQPSVSSDGNVLVAIRQYGLKYSIVQIDIESGNETILLQSDKYDFIQPSLNAVGSKLAFLRLDGTRAAVCVMNFSDRDYEVVYNGEGEITDPGYPHWNEEVLLITDNSRGRLETFEISENNTVIPVVSDPAGVLWADKNDRGIYYSTFSGTGYVIKMKPAEEWGNVPAFNGPTMPGEIMTFGVLESDYPDFKPYEKLSEVEVSKEELKEKYKSQKNIEKPVPIDGKVVKHRNTETIEKLDKLPEPQTVLSEEKVYIPLMKPLFYLPMVGLVQDNDNTYFGVGAFAFLTTPRMQLSQGIGIIDTFYFPQINNFGFDFDIFMPLGTGTLQLLFNRVLVGVNGDNIIRFKEMNMIDVGYVHPLYSINTVREEIQINALADIKAAKGLSSTEAFSAFSKTDYSKSLAGMAGFEFIGSKLDCEKKYSLASDIIGIGLHDFNGNANYAGLESEIELMVMNSLSKIGLNFDAKLRYTDFPVDINVDYSLLKFNGKILDSSYPGRSVFQTGLIYDNAMGSGLSCRMYEEALVSFGKNTVDYETKDSGNFMNITPNEKFVTGVEVGIIQPGIRMVYGYTFLVDFNKNTFEPGSFYFNLKMNIIRM